jgi:hypothetical protein
MTASGAWISISVIRPGGSHWEYEVTDMVNMDQLTAVGEPAEATWTVAPETVEEAPPAPPPPSPRRSAGAFLRRRWVRVSLAGVLTGALLAVLVSGIVNDVQTHTALSGAQRQLTSTRGQLASTKSDLDGAEAALATSRQLVEGLDATISQQRGQLAANSTEIGNLGDCLNGTLKMMDELSNGDSAAVAGTLTAINSRCQAAFDGLP